MKNYILRLDTKKYVGLIKAGQNISDVFETDIHYAFPFDDKEAAMEYAEAINTNTKIWGKKINSKYKVVEITELTKTTKVTYREKIK